jgi:broad specificity phosphatase PhoE
MKLYLTRHTQTNYNEAGLCNDDPAVDVHLSAIGLEQAQQLAERLKDQQFELILTSTLPRTRQTAAIVNQYHDAPIESDECINDNRTGFEGRPVEEYFKARDAASDLWAFKPAGAESLNDIRVRVEAFLADLHKRPYQAVLIVTHQGILRQIRGIINQLSKEEMLQLDIPQSEYLELEL